ncbi:MAG: type II toxin-antitoxin system VapC family toxin [Bryobacterales bacterium]|nr:type II toxin-antitoxin system VapC family toxin [Bryobacterales bacterium]
MRLLLDTHVWLWFLAGDKRLSRRQRQAIEDPAAVLFLSPISLWETCLLIEQGRLPAKAGSTHQWIEQARQALPVREAPLTFAIAALSRQIDLPHQDPADRFIAATALELKMPLLTSDERLAGCEGLRCLR